VENLSLEQKLMFVYVVSTHKKRVEELCARLQELVAKSKASDFTPSPMNNFAAEFIIAANDGEHGKLLRSLRHKLGDMYDRLSDSGGDTEIIRGIQGEMEELNPQLAKVEQSFEELYKTLMVKKRDYVEMN
jgi:hypothetical protein